MAEIASAMARLDVSHKPFFRRVLPTLERTASHETTSAAAGSSTPASMSPIQQWSGADMTVVLSALARLHPDSPELTDPFCEAVVHTLVSQRVPQFSSARAVSILSSLYTLGVRSEELLERIVPLLQANLSKTRPDKLYDAAATLSRASGRPISPQVEELAASLLQALYDHRHSCKPQHFAGGVAACMSLLRDQADPKLLQACRSHCISFPPSEVAPSSTAALLRSLGSEASLDMPFVGWSARVFREIQSWNPRLLASVASAASRLGVHSGQGQLAPLWDWLRRIVEAVAAQPDTDWTAFELSVLMRTLAEQRIYAAPLLAVAERMCTAQASAHTAAERDLHWDGRLNLRDWTDILWSYATLQHRAAADPDWWALVGPAVEREVLAGLRRLEELNASGAAPGLRPAGLTSQWDDDEGSSSVDVAGHESVPAPIRHREQLRQAQDAGTQLKLVSRLTWAVRMLHPPTASRIAAAVSDTLLKSAAAADALEDSDLVVLVAARNQGVRTDRATLEHWSNLLAPRLCSQRHSGETAEPPRLNEELFQLLVRERATSDSSVLAAVFDGAMVRALDSLLSTAEGSAQQLDMVCRMLRLLATQQAIPPSIVDRMSKLEVRSPTRHTAPA